MSTFQGPMDELRERINEFGSLSLDWDSFGAEPIHSNAIKVALIACGWIENNEILVPVAFPTSSGGVTLKWRTRANIDIDIEFNRDTSVTLVFDDDPIRFHNWQELLDELPATLVGLMTED